MTQQPIRFDDGAAYERMMGAWSQLVGQVFLDWLSPATGQRWIDVGCGNGAFTEQLIQRCAPAEAQGIETRAITVQRSFDSFDNFWQVTTATGGPRATLELMEADAIAELKERVRGRLPADGQGRITFGACANAIKGHVPKSP